MPLLLRESEVRELVSMADLIECMNRALTAFSSGTVQQPVRTVLDVNGNFFGLMPSYLTQAPALGAKLVTVFNGNADRGLPTHLATILLLSPLTGELLAILDGRYITEARTAAVSAVSAQKLARPDAAVLAIIGSGVQARSHVEALREVHKFREIRAWSPNEERLVKFAGDMNLTASPSAEEAVREADVIALVTASTEPVLFSDWVKEGAHVIAVGACRPTHREVDPILMRRARVYVDSREAAMREAGDIILSNCTIAGELGEGIARNNGREITVFKSLGLAVEDVASAQLVYERAMAQGKGTQWQMD
jgi:alanine dehydrogenase